MSLLVRNLRKEFPTRAEPLSILRGIDLDLEKGQALAILGPSGSGKSTLLHILGTLDIPSAGSVSLDGQDPFSLAKSALADFRNQRIGFVFQDHHLLPQCAVLENVLIPTLVKKNRDSAALEARARQMLDRVGLSSRLEHRPAELSGGERQRVALARALICQPALILADEPTGNLDRKSAHEIGQLLLELPQRENAMLIVVTHSTELARTLPRQLEMNDGRLGAWSGETP